MNARATGLGSFVDMEGGMGAVTKAFVVGGAVIGAAVLGAAAISTKWAMDFQQSTANIAAQAGITVKAAQDIGKAFLGEAGTVTFSAEEEEKALAPVAARIEMMTGRALTAADAQKIMGVAMRLAEASGQDLSATTDALVSVMQTYRIGLDGASKASDILWNTSKLTNTSLSDVATMVDKLHAKLGDAAPALSDVSTLMVELNQRGITGARGVQVVNTAFATLLDGSKAVEGEASKLGISIFDANGKFVGMDSIIGQLKPKLAGMTQAQQDLALKTLFGSGAAQVMNGIIQSGTDGYNKAAAAVGQLGTTQAAAAEQTSTVDAQMKMLMASLKDIGTMAGLTFLPFINSMLGAAMPAVHQFAAFMMGPGGQGLTSFLGHAQQTGQQVQEMGKQFFSSKAFGEVMTAAVQTFGPIFADAKKAVVDFMKEHKATFESIAAITKEVMNEIAPLILAVLNMIKHFWHDHGQQVMAIVGAVFDIILGIIKHVMEIIRDVIKLITDIIKGDWHAVWQDVIHIIEDAAGLIWDAIKGLFNLFVKLLEWVLPMTWDFAKGLISGIVTGIVDGADAIWNALKGVLSSAWQNAKDFLHISSPSQVFADEIGKPISQGIGKGITNAASSATGALTGVLGGMTGMGAGAGFAAMGGGGGGQIVFDFRGSQMMSDRDMETLAGKLLPALGRLSVGAGIKFRV